MKLPDLSKSEFAVLRVLWDDGDLTFPEVHERLDRGWAYTTTKTVMDRMCKKGLLDRQKLHGVFVYRPLISRTKGMARMIKFFAEDVLEMETNTVVAMFAENERISTEEIADLQRLVSALDEE